MTLASLLKRSEVWGTAFKRNLFLKARLKLTAIYVLIIAIVICGFSLFLYQSTIKNLSDASEEDFAGSASRQHFVEAAKDTLQHTLIVSDLFILLFSAGVGYVLAGRTLRPVEESHDAQRAFASKASHELRTPLTIMKNDIEVLKRSARPTLNQMQITFDSNLEEIEKMTTLVEDLLILARTEHSLDKSKELIAIEQLVQRVCARMEPLASQKGIRLLREGDSKAKIRGNKDALSRALINIIKNAIEHTSAEGTIQITLSKGSECEVISITDTGTGISPIDLPHVFTRFYKGTQPSSAREGTGLGLAIVKEIIEQHNGTIVIQSEIHKGTTVILSLPYA